MVCEWHSAPLGELISYIGKGVAPKYINDGLDATMVLGQKCVRNQSLQYEQARFHNSAEKAVNPDKEVRKGDILINATGVGSAGRVAQVMADPSRQCITDGHVITLRAKDINPFYLGYFVKSKQKTIELMAEGSTGQTEMNRQRLQSEIIVTFPESKDLQKRIAEYGLAIDKKITVNNQLNDYLFELVSSVFAHRFSDNVNTTELKNVLSISTKALKPQEHADEIWEHYSIPAFDEKHRPIFEPASGIKSNKYQIDSECILISKLNPSTKRIWMPCCSSNNAVCSTEFIVYRPYLKEYKSFYYAAIDSPRFTDYLLEHVSGSTGSRQRAQPKDTLNYLMPNPDNEEIKDFCIFADPIYRHIQINEQQTAKLELLRETLLPKLMSGTIDVSKVDLTQLTNNHLPARGHNVPNRYWKEHLWKPLLITFCRRCRTCLIRHSSNIWPKCSESHCCQFRKHQCRRIC